MPCVQTEGRSPWLASASGPFTVQSDMDKSRTFGTQVSRLAERICAKILFYLMAGMQT